MYSITNVLNILTVRLQNADYYHRKNFFGAVKDMIKVDRHRMFYKGLLPLLVASVNLNTGSEIAALLSYFPIDTVKFSAPFVWLAGCLMAHPFFLVSMRVQCSHFAHTTRAQQ
mmetsp:Transcript_34727/g.53311  ORF Transcript_34727/g.53311 Transcript_34727/m.53311 type:complete len:113 (+) Transcript_34727:791-1129(+)